MDRLHDGGEHVAEYDWTETAPSTAVVEVVAAAAGCRPLDLALLYDRLDADALDGLLAAADGAEVTFSYAAHDVTVTGDGTVRARASE